MSLNWVMIAEDRQSFTPLSVSVERSTDAASQAPRFSLDSKDGTVFLTNRRIVYLPSRPTAALESFAAPILNCADAHVAAPFFGPNVWTAAVSPVPGGNVPADCSRLAVRLTFKDGGAYDFHGGFERVKERTVQAVEVAAESGRLGTAAAGLDAVHLDELPAYEHAAADGRPPLLAGERGVAAAAAPTVVPPEEPPTYEDVQLETVTHEMESRMRLQG